MMIRCSFVHDLFERLACRAAGPNGHDRSNKRHADTQHHATHVHEIQDVVGRALECCDHGSNGTTA